MASSTMYPPHSRGVLLITASHAGSNLFMRSMVSGQDKSKVDSMSYNFGTTIVEIASPLLDTGIQAYDESKKSQTRKIYRRQTLQLLDRFGATVAQRKLMVDEEHAILLCRPDLLHMEHPYRKDPDADPVLEPLNQYLLERDEDDPKDRAFDNPHWYTSTSTNVSVLPDDFLLSVIPVFLIYNPARMVPAYIRASTEVTPTKAAAISTLLWTRKMYDWYVARDPRFAPESGRKPIVIDAVDLSNSAGLRTELANAMGVDPEKILTSWPVVPEEDVQKMDPLSVLMNQTLPMSTGLVLETAGAGDEGWEKWKAELGETVANVVKTAVDGEMPHWQFLKSKAWVPSNGH